MKTWKAPLRSWIPFLLFLDLQLDCILSECRDLEVGIIILFMFRHFVTLVESDYPCGNFSQRIHFGLSLAGLGSELVTFQGKRRSVLTVYWMPQVSEILCVQSM